MNKADWHAPEWDDSHADTLYSISGSIMEGSMLEHDAEHAVACDRRNLEIGVRFFKGARTCDVAKLPLPFVTQEFLLRLLTAMAVGIPFAREGVPLMLSEAANFSTFGKGRNPSSCKNCPESLCASLCL